MMKAVKISITLCLLIAAPVMVQAQSASKDFPSDKDAGVNNVAVGTSGDMKIRAIFKMSPPVKTDLVDLIGPKAGAVVAADGANKVCEAALAAGYLCPVTAPCPCTATAAAAFIETFTIGGFGFDLVKLAGDPKFLVGPSGVGQAVNALTHNTTAGNTIGTDPLPIYLIRVDKRNVDGVVGFSVDISPPGAPVSFNVDTTGLDDLALHQAIRTGFLGLNLGLAAVVRPATDAQVHSHVQEAFNGPFVHIPNAAAKGVLQINVSGLQGQDTVVETAVFKGKPIPALGPGGMLFLTLLLTLTGAWMLHRRRREA